MLTSAAVRLLLINRPYEGRLARYPALLSEACATP